MPDAGGIFDQDERAINKLIVIFNHLEEWRKIEMDKQSNIDKNKSEQGRR